MADPIDLLPLKLGRPIYSGGRSKDKPFLKTTTHLSKDVTGVAIGLETFGLGIVIIVALAIVWKIIDATIRGFFGSVGESLYSRITEKFSSAAEDERPFTGASFEKKLIEEIDDLNPLRQTEIHHVDYDYKSGGSAILEYTSESRERLAVRKEVENVAYAFASTILKKSQPCGEINVNVLHENETPIAHYHIDRKWADSFNREEIDDIEFVERIMDTYEWMYEENEWNE